MATVVVTTPLLGDSGINQCLQLESGQYTNVSGDIQMVGPTLENKGIYIII